MRPYRPTIDQLKKRYSADMARRKREERWRAMRGPNWKKSRIPDNSEPWLPHPVRSLADAMWISEQVGKHIEQWKRTVLPEGWSDN